MKLIYIAGPIKAPTEAQVQANLDYACYRASFYWKEGYSVICPHANTRNVDPYIKSEFDWIPGDVEQVKRCDAICLLKGWEKSEGSKVELTVALRQGLEIIVDEEESFKVWGVNNLDPNTKSDILDRIEKFSGKNSFITLEQIG